MEEVHLGRVLYSFSPMLFHVIRSWWVVVVVVVGVGCANGPALSMSMGVRVVKFLGCLLLERVGVVGIGG